jgi:hypothetical protein
MSDLKLNSTVDVMGLSPLNFAVNVMRLCFFQFSKAYLKRILKQKLTLS